MAYASTHFLEDVGGRTCCGNWSSQPRGRVLASAAPKRGSFAGTVRRLTPTWDRLLAVRPLSRQILPELQDALSSTRGATLGLLPPRGGKTEVILWKKLLLVVGNCTTTR